MIMDCPDNQNGFDFILDSIYSVNAHFDAIFKSKDFLLDAMVDGG